jgi:hypothetical protein
MLFPTIMWFWHVFRFFRKCPVISENFLSVNFFTNEVYTRIFVIYVNSVHEIFDLYFFHQTTPPRPLRHGLKPFSIWISIRGANRLCNRRLLSQRSHWLRCAALQILKKFQRSHWHRCDMHSGVNDSAVITKSIFSANTNDSAVQIWHRCDFWRNLCKALATFKGNIYRKNIHRVIVLHFTYNFHTQKMGVN